MTELADAAKRGEDVTELVELRADRVDAVGSPANGTPWLLLKATDAADSSTKQCELCNGSGKIRAGHVTCPDCKGKGTMPASAEKSDSPEADQIEDEVTGTAKSVEYCGDPECDACIKAELVPLTVRTAHASGVAKATLRAADRKKMPASSFAYVDPKGGKHLPIHDEAHVDAALGRFGQQDFSDADDPADAKAKAAGKIKSAAGRFGIKLDDSSDVAQAAKEEQAEKGEVQDALNGTKAPEEGGQLDTGKSGLAGPATGDPKDLPATLPEGQPASSNSGVVARLAGGESAYEIPAEANAGVENAAPARPQVAAMTVKTMAVASLVDAMAKIEEQRQAVKDGRYLQVPGPDTDASTAPGSMPWETYDAATLDQVASALASCCNAIDAIATREQIEALSGDTGDQVDAWDLSDASTALEYAMGVCARLAYSEQAAAGGAAKSEDPHYAAVEKAYRRLRASDEKALRDAHAALSNVLAEHDQKVVDAGQDDSTEGDKIQMELTKSEFIAGVQEILKAEQDARDARKAKRNAKKAKREEKAAKNANNNGDITAQQLQDGVVSEQDANDVQAVQGAVDPKYANKSEADASAQEEAPAQPALKAIEDQLKAVVDTVGSLGEQVQKFAKRPRQGGPVLDGQARGAFPAAENRMTEAAKSSDMDTPEIKSLEEQLTKAQEKGDPIAISNISNQLTYQRLVRGHELGRI